MSCKDLCPVLGEDASEEHIVSGLHLRTCMTIYTVKPLYIKGHLYWDQQFLSLIGRCHFHRGLTYTKGIVWGK